jgi:hypothetical protein
MAATTNPTHAEGNDVSTTEVERHHDVPAVQDVDLAEVPSANWGWSRVNHRTWHLVGFGVAAFLLCMLRGNQVGHIEDVFLIVLAAATLFVTLRDMWGRRRGWIR